MSDRYHSINWGNCAQEARNCARPPSFASPPSCSSSASGSAEKATAAERLFDMAVQRQEAAQKKMEEAREIERKTKVYELPLCTFSHIFTFPSPFCYLFHRQSLCCQTKLSTAYYRKLETILSRDRAREFQRRWRRSALHRVTA